MTLAVDTLSPDQRAAMLANRLRFELPAHARPELKIAFRRAAEGAELRIVLGDFRVAVGEIDPDAWHVISRELRAVCNAAAEQRTSA